MRVLIIIIAVAVVVYFSISLLGAVTIMKAPRLPVEQPPMSVEDVTFPSRIDGVMLKGWFIPGGEFAIIMVTGGHQNRSNPEEGTLELAKGLNDRGFSVLLFDQRGRGESEGDATLLLHSNKDLGGAIDYLQGEGYSHIAIIGFSLGAISALELANEVEAVVADGCFANVTKPLAILLEKKTRIPGVIVRAFLPGIFLMAGIVYGYDRIDPIDVVKDVKCPILFIHEEADDLTSLEDAYSLYETSGNPEDEFWVVPDAEHCQGYNTDPEAYIDSVTSFFGICSEEKE